MDGYQHGLRVFNERHFLIRKKSGRRVVETHVPLLGFSTAIQRPVSRQNDRYEAVRGYPAWLERQATCI